MSNDTDRSDLRIAISHVRMSSASISASEKIQSVLGMGAVACMLQPSLSRITTGRIAGGSNAAIGDTIRQFASCGRIGPPTDREYPVEPAGVETIIPSQATSIESDSRPILNFTIDGPIVFTTVSLSESKRVVRSSTISSFSSRGKESDSKVVSAESVAGSDNRNPLCPKLIPRKGSHSWAWARTARKRVPSPPSVTIMLSPRSAQDRMTRPDAKSRRSSR